MFFLLFFVSFWTKRKFFDVEKRLLTTTTTTKSGKNARNESNKTSIQLVLLIRFHVDERRKREKWKWLNDKEPCVQFHSRQKQMATNMSGSHEFVYKRVHINKSINFPAQIKTTSTDKVTHTHTDKDALPLACAKRRRRTSNCMCARFHRFEIVFRSFFSLFSLLLFHTRRPSTEQKRVNYIRAIILLYLTNYHSAVVRH